MTPELREQMVEAAAAAIGEHYGWDHPALLAGRKAVDAITPLIDANGDR